MKVWSWRHAIQKSKLPATTKLVLFNLSVYMNERGQGCYPTTKDQAKDISMSEKSVIDHLKIAVDEGFVIKKLHGRSGQEWANHEYVATMPKGTEIGSAPFKDGKFSPPEHEIVTHKGAVSETSKHHYEGFKNAINDDSGDEDNDNFCSAFYEDNKALKQVQQLEQEGTEVGSVRKCEGTEPDDQKALKQVQSNTSINTPLSSSSRNNLDDGIKNNYADDLKKIFTVLGYQPSSPLRVEEWKQKGADIDKHIIPAIREAMRRNGGKTASSLKYFDKIVREFMEKNKPISSKKSKKNRQLTPWELTVAKMGNINWHICKNMFVSRRDLRSFELFQEKHGKVTWNNLEQYYEQKKQQDNGVASVQETAGS